MVSSSLAALAVAASALAVGTNAHSYMTDPMPTWSVGYPTTNYAGLIDGQDYLPVPKGMSYGGTPEGNTEAYWTAFNASKYTSLKDLADKTMVLQSLSPFGKATAECVFSLANGTARDLPAQVEWKDFGYSHQGPCEVWCDDKLAFMDTNCALHYPEVPAKVPYDVEVCAGASMIQSYWIALHGLPWQLYLNCVPLTGKVNGTANAVASDSDAAKTPSAATPTTSTTDAPTAVTEAPEASTDESVDGSAESTPTTDAPVTTDAPEASTTDASDAAEMPEATPATPTATEPTSQTDAGTSGAKRLKTRPAFWGD